MKKKPEDKNIWDQKSKGEKKPPTLRREVEYTVVMKKSCGSVNCFAQDSVPDGTASP